MPVPVALSPLLIYNTIVHSRTTPLIGRWRCGTRVARLHASRAGRSRMGRSDGTSAGTRISRSS